MKVYLEDNDGVKASSKRKQKGATPPSGFATPETPNSPPPARSSRKGGFKRKQSAKTSVDDLIESGADGVEQEEPAAPKKSAPIKGPSMSTMSSADYQNEEPTVSEPQPEPDAGPEESVQSERRTVSMSSGYDDDEVEEDEPPQPKGRPTAAPKQNRFIADSGGKKGKQNRFVDDADSKGKPHKFGNDGAKKGKQSKPTQDSSKGKAKRSSRDDVVAQEEELYNQKKQNKAKKQPLVKESKRSPKEPNNPKKVSQEYHDEEQPVRKGKRPLPESKPSRERAHKGGGGQVVVAQESIGSQIIVLLEVIAGGALMFFGGMQLGSILINNIVSGMLGG